MKKTKRFAAWRPDRVILKRSSVLKPISIRVVGDYAIPVYEKERGRYEDEVVMASDHLGLLTTFETIE